jgi:Spy/CpxP family protein refolding chaperone
MKRLLIPLLLPLVAASPLRAEPEDVFEFSHFDMPAPPMVHHGALLAWGPYPDEGLPADPMRLVLLAERLELTQEQRQALGKIMDDAAPRLRELMFRLQDSRRELDAMLDAAGTDDAALRRFADEQGRLHADLLYLQAGTRAKLRALLNDDQREKLEEGGSGLRGPFARLRAVHPRRGRD